MKKEFYEFRQAENGNTELLIYSNISSNCGVNGAYIANRLEGLTDDLVVRINSYGGEVCEGLAIYNLLKDHGKKHKVTTVCDGFACSAASVVFMAGTERVMQEGSLLLIHNAWAYAEGDANAMRKTADDLDKVTRPSLEIYKSVSNLSEEEIKALMDAETWILPEEAIEMGFATSIDKRKAEQSINECYLLRQIGKNREIEAKYKQLLDSYIALADTDSWAKYFK